MPIVYCLERPQNSEAPQYGTIVVEGWAFSTDGEITKVEVACGKRIIDADLRFERKDVAQCHSAFAERAGRSGFRAEIPLTDREKKKGFDICVSFFSENEVVKTQTVQVLPEGGAEVKTSWPQRFLFAIKMVIQYFRAGKFPRSLADWKVCIYKFLKLLSPCRAVDHTGFQNNKNRYQIWCLKNGISEKKRQELIREGNRFSYRPLISIIMPAYKTDSGLLRQALDSVKQQLYTNWEIYIVDDCTPGGNVREIAEEYSSEDKRFHYFRMAQNSHISLTTNQGVSLSKGEFIFLMDHDDLLTEDSLFYVVQRLNKNPDLDIIYSDDDKITMDNQQFEPQFKPDFSPELLLSYMYFSHIFVMRRTLFDEVGGFRAGYEGSQDHDLALRATEKTDQIAHIPRVLYHWRATPTSTAMSTDSKPYSLLNGLKAVQDAVDRRGIEAKAIMPKFAEANKLGIFTLRYNGKQTPLISIVIPSKNYKDILERCINSIEKKTTYQNYEIIVIDNDSDDPKTLAYLRQLGHTVLTLGNINNRFSFSRMVNFGVRQSHGEYVVLLNNDTEVITENWLENMLVYMRIKGVGAVGCKLLYSDHTVQHAGVVLKMGNGVAGHAFKLSHELDGGYMSFANVARNYSAVTAACLMTSRAVYDKVHGFDEDDFAESFNDVDFCMKIRQCGLRIVYNPEALLFHHEGKTRGVEQTGHYSDPQEEYRFVTKWKLDRHFTDEYYSPNLSIENEQFLVDERHVYVQERKKIRVLLITQCLELGGAPLLQLKICRGLLPKGYQFVVLSMRDGPLRDDYQSLGIEVVVKEVDAGTQFMSSKKYAQFLEEAAQIYSGRGIDLVYANTIECFWGVGLSERLGVPSMWGIHESVDYRNYFSGFCAEVQRQAIRYFSLAARVVFVADATRNMYQELDASNYVTIRIGLDEATVGAYKRAHAKADMRKTLGIDADKKMITIVGTVCQRKGQHIFVKAAEKLLAQRKDLYFCIVGGKDEGYYQSLERYIKKNNLEEHVQLCGAHRDVYKYFRASDIFVCASYEESSPMVILEAMLFEVPIVSTNVFGIPEMIRNDREGLMIGPGNPKALAAKIAELLDKPELCRELTYNAYYRGLLHFSQNTMLQTYDLTMQEAVLEGENAVYRAQEEK